MDLRNDLFDDLSDEVCTDSVSFVETDSVRVFLESVLNPFSGLRTGGGGIARCIV